MYDSESITILRLELTDTISLYGNEEEANTGWDETGSEGNLPEGEKTPVTGDRGTASEGKGTKEDLKLMECETLGAIGLVNDWPKLSE